MRKYLSDPNMQEKKNEMEKEFRNKMFSGLNAEERYLWAHI